jgi:hypothetical protein
MIDKYFVIQMKKKAINPRDLIGKVMNLYFMKQYINLIRGMWEQNLSKGQRNEN